MAIRAAVMFVVGIALIACGGAGGESDLFGPSPNFAEIRADFAKPSGTFAAGDEAHAFQAYADKRATAHATSPVIGVVSSGVSSQLLAALEVSPSKTTCRALAHGDVTGTCTCSGGGAFTYDLTGVDRTRAASGPMDVTLKGRFFRCNDGHTTLDGQEFVHMLRASGTPADLEMLLDSRITVEKEGKTHLYEHELAYENGTWWTEVVVKDGTLVIGDQGWDDTAKSGTLTVRDRQGTWTCTTTAGKGRCRSTKGATRDVR